jgi:large subunit ribosomal protein L25
MATIEFTAFPRTSEGRGASRRMRRTGKAPGIVYGGTNEPTPIELDHNALVHALRNEAFHSSILTMKLDGAASKVLLRDVQMHPFRNEILHVDFQRVAADKKIHMSVPLHFVNEAISPGVKVAGGVVEHVMKELEIQCLPKDLPEFIEVDLANLQAGHSLHVSSLTLPAGVEAIVPKGEDPTVATVVIPRVMTADEEAAELAATTAAPTAADVPTTAQKKVEEEAAGGGGGAGSKPTVKDDKKNMKEAKK